MRSREIRIIRNVVVMNWLDNLLDYRLDDLMDNCFGFGLVSGRGLFGC